jgi:hypothetical protein
LRKLDVPVLALRPQANTSVLPNEVISVAHPVVVATVIVTTIAEEATHRAVTTTVVALAVATTMSEALLVMKITASVAATVVADVRKKTAATVVVVLTVMRADAMTATAAVETDVATTSAAMIVPTLHQHVRKPLVSMPVAVNTVAAMIATRVGKSAWTNRTLLLFPRLTSSMGLRDTGTGDLDFNSLHVFALWSIRAAATKSVTCYFEAERAFRHREKS